MPTPTSETLARITAATRLLVEGATWAGIAKLYGYASADSACSMLSQSYPEIWRAEYEIARTKYMAEIEAEAALTQRALLRPYRPYTDRDGNPAIQDVPVQVSQSAAHSLLSHAVRDRAQKHEISGPGGGPALIGIVLDASEIDNGRPHDSNGDGTAKPRD